MIIVCLLDLKVLFFILKLFVFGILLFGFFMMLFDLCLIEKGERFILFIFLMEYVFIFIYYFLI